MSPTVFREKGYRFFFFSREESRKHVHVISGDGEAKFWIEPEIQLADSHGYSRKQLKHWWKGIKMSLSAPGSNTSDVEVTNISSHGIWLLAHDRELFMPYSDFSWFREQPVRAILNVKEVAPGHFYWPDLDVDLTEQIIEHPEQYPNVADNP